jgi:hypothetical protein
LSRAVVNAITACVVLGMATLKLSASPSLNPPAKNKIASNSFVADRLAGC